MSIDPVYAFGETVPARGFSPPEPPIVNEYEGQDPEMWLYRERTIAILRRYLRFSIEVGR